MSKLLILTSIILVFSCSNQLDTGEKYLRNLPYGEFGTVNSVYNQIAGVTGEVNWNSFKPEKYKNNPNIICVEVSVKRNFKESKYKSLKVQYLVNEKLKNVKIGYIEINGKPASLLEFGFAMEIMLLESVNGEE